MGHRIIIRDVDKPRRSGKKNNVKWVCDSLGFVNGRDLDCVSFKLIYKLLNLFSKNDLISTDEVAKLLDIDSHRVNYHIRVLMESGIVFRKKRKIALRGGSLSSAIEEMKRNSDNMFNRILEVSRKIDSDFKL